MTIPPHTHLPVGLLASSSNVLFAALLLVQYPDRLTTTVTFATRHNNLLRLPQKYKEQMAKIQSQNTKRSLRRNTYILYQCHSDIRSTCNTMASFSFAISKQAIVEPSLIERATNTSGCVKIETITCSQLFGGLCRYISSKVWQGRVQQRLRYSLQQLTTHCAHIICHVHTMVLDDRLNYR